MRMNWVDGLLDRLPPVIKSVGGNPQLRFLTLVLVIVEVILGALFPFTSGLHHTILIVGLITIPFCLIIVVTIMMWKPPRGVTDIRVDLVSPPTDERKYNALFDGFAGSKFYAFNPPFMVEEEKGSEQFERAIETHKKRYDSGCTAQYLFFDEESLRRGKNFFRELESQLGRDKSKKALSIRFWGKGTYTPGYTFFIGEKGEDKPSCILYPTVATSEGIPTVVVVIEGHTGMYNIMQGHFNRYFNKAKNVNID